MKRTEQRKKRLVPIYAPTMPPLPLPFPPRVYLKTPWVWDGSDLGEFDPDVIIDAKKHWAGTYWLVQLGTYEKTCLAKQVKNTYANIIDELKPIFGLRKQGTHRISIRTRDRVKHYLLTDVKMNEGKYILPDIPLQHYDIANPDWYRLQQDTQSLGIVPTWSLSEYCLKYPFFRTLIQGIFAFREILGVSLPYDSSIGVRITHNKLVPLVPISLRESGIIINRLPSGIQITPQTIIDRWFDPHPEKGAKALADVIRGLVTHDPNDITGTLIRLRTNIERTIRRVDKNTIWYTTFIVDRVAHYLLQHQNP